MQNKMTVAHCEKRTKRDSINLYDNHKTSTDIEKVQELAFQ